MAKKKESNAEVFNIDVMSQLVKDYGDIIRPASEILDDTKEVFSTGSPLLDNALGGGVQEGCLIEVAGPPKSGKSTTILQTLASYQKKGRNCYYIDAENRFDKKNLEIHGLDTTKLRLIRSDENSILDAVHILSIIEHIMKNDKGAAIVLDSASALCSREKIGEEVTAQRRDTRPKLWSDFLSSNNSYIRINNISLFVVRHLISTQNPMGKKWTTDGGVKLDYYKSVSIHCKYCERWIQKEKQIGQVLHWEVECSNFGGPVQSVDSYIRYGYGIDEEKECFTMAVDYGLVSKAGSWFTLSFLESDEPVKFQGDENAIEYLRNNPEAYNALKVKLKETMV